MRILILGSQGFIGQNIINKMILNHEIHGCDIVEFHSTEYEYSKISIFSQNFSYLLKDKTFDICINAAGSGNIGFSIDKPFNDFDLNTSAVFQVLNTIKEFQPRCKFLHISSAAVYGNPKSLPINETDSLNPVSPYGFHKLMSEIVCKEYFELYKIPISIIRPFSVYGPGLKKQLFWDILRKLKTCKDYSISLFGHGEESRDFIYITDLIDLIELIIEKDNFTMSIYNAASGNETMIKDIAKKIHEFLPESEIKFSGETRSGDPINWRASISLIKKLGFKPKVGIEEGISLYIDWFNKYYNE